MRLSKFPMAALHMTLILPMLTACGGGGSTSASSSNATTTAATTFTSTSIPLPNAPKSATVLPSSVNSLNLLDFQNRRMDSSSTEGLAASVADLSKGSYSFSGQDYGTAMIFGVTGSDGSLVNTRYVEVESEGSLR